MLETPNVIKMAHAFAAHSGRRMAIIAQNTANADTPGYEAKDLASFAAEPLQLKLRSTRAVHFHETNADAMARPKASGMDRAPNGNSVSLDEEMMHAAQAKQNHEMALAIYQNASSILTSSLGRK